MEMPHWLESIIKPDFIRNTVFEVRMVDVTVGLPALSLSEKKKLREDYANNVYEVSVTYYPLGQTAIKFNEVIYVRLGNEAEPEFRNVRNAGASALSAMGRNFIRQYKSLMKSLQPDEVIVAKKVERTNGVLVYKDKNQNLLDTDFATKDLLLNLINGEDSLVGVTDETGRVFEISTGDRETIFALNEDLDSNLREKHYRQVPGTTQVVEGRLYTTESIPSGSVVFIHKFRNEEDPEDETRKIPIVLKGRKLNKKDAGFIYSIISNYKKRNEEVKFIAKLKDGTTKEVSIAGFTYIKAL